jgi:hypothetical protein
MKRMLPIGAALVLLVVSAVVQGRWSERWMEFPELKVYAEQFANVPMEIGDWTGEAREEPSKKILEAAGSIGSLSREYHNDRGETVSVFLYCGRPQHMLFHEPSKCYGAAGFERVESESQRHEIALGNGDVANFFSARFVKSDPNSGKQDEQVYWSWCGDGKWEAPDETRWAFPGQRAIYKLYVVFTPTRDQSAEHNPAVDFIPVLIPKLNEAFAKAMTASPADAKPK